MTNTNCLKGFQCPKCKAYEPFVIEVTTFVVFNDDGSDYDHDGYEWNENSYCRCVSCGKDGIVEKFMAE